MLVILYSTNKTLNFHSIQLLQFSFEREKLIWLALFLGFAVKVPIIPFHLWLPEAHVEAPTSGSVLLAGVLLKLGTYGIVRFLLILLPNRSIYFMPFVHVIAIVRVIWARFSAIRQIDIKRVIAYSSISHINLTILGLFSFTQEGVEGSLVQIISHGFVSRGLFLCIGYLYSRYHSRAINYYSGLTHTIPYLVHFFLFFTVANISLPGTSRFIGELMLLIGLSKTNNGVVIMVLISMLSARIYSLWLINRLAFGYLSYELENQIKLKNDLTFLETRI